jgi:hypothetical protein
VGCARSSKLKALTTAIAASAWIGVCAYLYDAWPCLAGVLGIPLPRTVFLSLGPAAAIGLRVKDRWMRAPTALFVDALIAAPPLAAIGFFLDPFLFPVD